MSATSSGLSRRRLLTLVGAVAGSAAVHELATAMGLVPTVAAAIPLELSSVGDRRPRVAVLGAGISGLTTAYELGKVGCDVVVLEAAARAGGRNLTLRGGDGVDELGNPQRCEFDREPHLYFNAGPARIPGGHTALLGYCRELEVPLEIFCNEDRNALVQDDAAFGGRPVLNREFAADAQGYLAELLAKSLDPARLDARFDAVDAERVIEFARTFGDLDPDLVYRGSSRAGFAGGGFAVPARKKGTLDFGELLKAGFWRGPLYWGQLEDQAAPMMQPVGGMDQVVAGFMRKVGHRVRLGAQVLAVRLEEDGVAVTYRRDDSVQTLQADYCFTCIPTHLLAGIEHNFPNDYAAALAAVPRGKLFKIAFQTSERFWEKQEIYGGISWTSQDISQIWYPTQGIHRDKGVILGAYTFGDDAGDRFERMTPGERLETAIVQGEKLHPGYRQFIENGVSVPWHRMNHMLGCAARWTDELRARHFARLQAPVGRHYLIGDQVSYHPGWQEGAIRSAHHAMRELDKRVNEAGRRATA